MQTGVDVAKLLSHKKKLEAKRLRKEKKAAKKAKKEAKKRVKEAAGHTNKHQVAKKQCVWMRVCEMCKSPHWVYFNYFPFH